MYVVVVTMTVAVAVAVTMAVAMAVVVAVAMAAVVAVAMLNGWGRIQTALLFHLPPPLLTLFTYTSSRAAV
jgi:hypothetical protein